MAADAIVCAACSMPVPRDFWNRDEGVRCRGCGHNVRVTVFPAIDLHPIGAAPEALQVETEVELLLSPAKPRRPRLRRMRPLPLLCALCDLDVDGRHICPRCFETGVSTHKIQTVEQRRTMYDTVALALSTLPFLLIWPALIAAPWALVMVFTRWNAPSSLDPRTKIRFPAKPPSSPWPNSA